MITKITRIGFEVALVVLFAIPVSAGWPPVYTQNFDGVRSPSLPSGWVASQGVNVTGAPLWVTSIVEPNTAPSDAFSTAPGNILDNRLDTPVLPITGASFGLKFSHSYNLENGRDGAVLEISSPDINGGAFTDITDPAVQAFVSPGYNTVISSGFQSPIAGRMAWSGNSGGYIVTGVTFGPTIPSQAKLRFRLVSDNAGASAGWRIDTFAVLRTEGPTPTPTPPASPTPTPTPIPTPCASPNMIADSTFEAGTPWPAWTVQTSTNFGTPLCDTATCGTGGAAPPYAGNNWAWFGGASAVETATLGQSVSILAGGQATLSFAMRIGTISFPLTDVLNVKVDGTIVQSYPEPASPETLYSLRTVDLGAFADGASHNILFEYVGPTSGTSSYAVDNVTLTNGAACSTPPPTVTPTATPTPTAPIFPTPTPTPSDCPGGGCNPSPSVTPPTTVTPTPSPTPPPTPSPTVTPPAGPAQTLNISTRLRVETADRVAIGGFIINGNAPKKVAIRGIGPSLISFGLSDILPDPTLELRNYDGVFLGANDDWQDDPASAGELTALGLALQDPKESGMVVTLEPGNYTAIMAGKNQATGIGVVEIYDADPAAASRLANISTRGFVRTGDNVMIAGFILGNGSDNADVVVRALGPSLSRFMIMDVLVDPTLELHDANGALLIANDNWEDDPASAAQLTARNLQLFHAAESGIFISLPPGAFTAIMAGKNGDVGIGLVEVYKVDALVTTTADSGPGSLRDAIAAARNGDTIQFDAGLHGQAINLTSGELVIDKSITIKGPGSDNLTVQRSTAGGTPALRIFHITPGHSVTIQGLTISNGFTQGGPPENWGGGIYNDGSTLAVDYCVISGNSAGSIGIPGSGGGIFNNSINSGHADLTISRSTVSGNSAHTNFFDSGSTGGGIHNNGAGPLHHAMVVLNETTVSGNSAASGAGICNNGFYTGNASLVVNNSTISGNVAVNGGGGISNQGTFKSGNASVIVSNSTISGNSARIGGAISNSGEGGSATLEVAHSTISDNSAVEQGGGLYNTGGATAARSVGGIYPEGSGGSAAVFRNTVLKAGLSGENIYNNLGEVSSAGYNLSSDNGGGFLTATGDQINTNPLLGPLENNGGPTFTHELPIGSPAVNTGDPNFTPPPSHDQRGFGYQRVISGRIDIGSFEFDP